MEDIRARTFHVEIEPERSTYRPGDVARVLAIVTRPAHEDPANQGIPVPSVTSAPAESVRVGISFWSKRYYWYGFGPLTDADGESVVKARVPRNAPAGPVTAAAGAERFVGTVLCFDVYEVGYTEDPRLFDIRE